MQISEGRCQQNEFCNVLCSLPLQSEPCVFLRKRLIALSQKEPVHLIDAMSTVEQEYKKVMTKISRLYRESIELYTEAAETQVSPSSTSLYPEGAVLQASQLSLANSEACLVSFSSLVSISYGAQGASPRRRRIVRNAMQFYHKKEEKLNQYVDRGQRDTEIKAEEMKKVRALKVSAKVIFWFEIMSLIFLFLLEMKVFATFVSVFF